MRKAMVLATTVALLGVSCGGSDDDGSSTTQPPSAEPTPDATGPATTEPLADEPASTEPLASAPPATVPMTTDAAEPETVDTFSPDGELGVSYTDSEDGPDVTVRLLDRAEWPPELAGGASSGAVKIFELEPDGAEFDEPVTVTRRLDVTAFEALGLGQFDVPLVTMLTQNEAGEYEVLGDLSIVRIGNDLYVTGTTTHFSAIIISNENRMIPWGPGEGDGISPTELAETYIDEDEFLSIMRGLFEAPPAQLVIDGDRYLSGTELFEYVHKVIEEQEAGGEDDGGASMTPGFELLDDGVIIESEPLDPTRTTTEDGAYRAERFGTAFLTVPVSLLPSTAALTGDPDATIGLTVWIPGIVMSPESVVGDPEPTEETPATDSPQTSEEMADCFMYLEMYPELLELDPGLTALCEANTDAARAMISTLLAELGM